MTSALLRLAAGARSPAAGPAVVAPVATAAPRRRAETGGWVAASRVGRALQDRAARAAGSRRVARRVLRVAAQAVPQVAARALVPAAA
jgi:hypothetical protein